MRHEDRVKARQMLDKRLQHLRGTNLFYRPSRGWIKAIREALGMTSAQLGRRIGVSQPQVLKMEKSELRQTITLDTLERAAQALGCQLIYALVPHQPLDETIRSKAHRLAMKQLQSTHHTMALEAQSISDEDEAAQLEQLTREIIAHAGSNLWEEKP